VRVQDRDAPAAEADDALVGELAEDLGGGLSGCAGECGELFVGELYLGPGSAGYHGGDWKFFAVTWNVAPYLLTSDEAVLAAAASGHVTVTRVPENDFKRPIQR
jgi:hypothetical protein